MTHLLLLVALAGTPHAAPITIVAFDRDTAIITATLPEGRTIKSIAARRAS